MSYDRKAKDLHHGAARAGRQLAGLEIPDDPASAINAARRAAGGALGPLGAAQGAPYTIGARRTRAEFRRRQDLLQPGDRSQRRHRSGPGKVRERRWPAGRPGLSDVAAKSTAAWRPRAGSAALPPKDKPVIFWTPDYGAVIVRGAMNAAWREARRRNGLARRSRWPTRPRTATSSPSGSAAAWSPGTTDQEDSAPSRPTWRPAGRSAGAGPGAAQGVDTAAPDSNGDKWFTPTWWWLLAIVPVLVLVGLVVVAALRNRAGATTWIDADDPVRRRHRARHRRRGEALRLEDSDDASAGLVESYAPAPGSAGTGWVGAVSEIRCASSRPMTAMSSPSSNPRRTSPTPRRRAIASEDGDPEASDAPTRVPTDERDPLTNRSACPDRDPTNRRRTAPRSTCRSTTRTRRRTAIRSRPIPSPGCTGSPAARSVRRRARRGLVRQRGTRSNQRLRQGQLGRRQILRMTVTTLPSTAASLPGIGSNAGLCGISHT